MSAKLLALVVLVQLYGVGQATNVEYIQESNSNEPVQNDGSSKHARLNELTLASFTWAYNSAASSKTLTVCTGEPLVTVPEHENQMTLVRKVGDNQETNCEGTFDPTNMQCATFWETLPCSLDISDQFVTYTLEVFEKRFPAADMNKSGTASFTMNVEAETLTCGDKTIIRATGTTKTDIVCVTPAVGGVCYTDGNIAASPFCFKATDSTQAELNLCLKDDHQYTSAPDGTLTITQLAYTTDGSASFSLTHADSGTNPMEAIVWKDTVPHEGCAFVSDSDSETCTITEFTASHAIYEVCSISSANGVLETAFSSITDLDVQAAADISLLQFRFTNANPAGKYVAKIVDSASTARSTVDIDCTGVAPDHICYGFLDPWIADEFLTIEYGTTDETTLNKIAIPYPV